MLSRGFLGMGCDRKKRTVRLSLLVIQYSLFQLACFSLYLCCLLKLVSMLLTSAFCPSSPLTLVRKLILFCFLFLVGFTTLASFRVCTPDLRNSRNKLLLVMASTEETD